jgi:hypothetical protein
LETDIEHSLIIIKHVQKNQHAIPKVLSGFLKFTNPTILFRHFIYQSILLSVEEIHEFFVNSSSVGLFIVEYARKVYHRMAAECKHDTMLQ